LATLAEAEKEVIAALQTSGATSLVKTLQMIQLQRAIMAVGMFSIFESILQDRLAVESGFAEARNILDNDGDSELKDRFSSFAAAINVLKHGKGKSYSTLLSSSTSLPFRVKRPEESFFCEGDVSEISTLIEVDDSFVMGCAAVIYEVSDAITRARPESFL